VTARLEGARYVVGQTDEPDTGEDEPAPVPAHLQGTLDVLRRALDRGEGCSVKALQLGTRKAGATLSRQRAALEGLGLAERKGGGVKGDPLVWWATAPDAAPAAPPTADPAYVRYLNSKAWAAKRAEILDRADGACEGCGDAVEPGEAEVHHLT
jgi:hypothetical protein